MEAPGLDGKLCTWNSFKRKKFIILQCGRTRNHKINNAYGQDAYGICKPSSWNK